MMDIRHVSQSRATIQVVYNEMKEQESSSSTNTSAAQKQQCHNNSSVNLCHMLQFESPQQN